MSVDGATLDLGAGYCHFINNVRSTKKLALDLNEENLVLHAHEDVELLTGPGTGIPLPDGSLDTSLRAMCLSTFKLGKMLRKASAKSGALSGRAVVF